MSCILINWSSLAFAELLEMFLSIGVATMVFVSVTMLKARATFLTKVIASKEPFRISDDIVMGLIE